MEARLTRLERDKLEANFQTKQAEAISRKLLRQLDAARLRCNDCPTCRVLPAPTVCERETGRKSGRSSRVSPRPDDDGLRVDGSALSLQPRTLSARRPPSSQRVGPEAEQLRRANEELDRLRAQLSAATPHTAKLLVDKDRTILHLKDKVSELESALGSGGTRQVAQLEAELRTSQLQKERLNEENRRLRLEASSRETNLLRCEDHLQRLTHQLESGRCETTSTPTSPAKRPSNGSGGILKRSRSDACLLQPSAKSPKSPRPAPTPRRSVNAYCESCQRLKRRLELVTVAQRQKAAAKPPLLPSGGTFPRAARFPSGSTPRVPATRPAIPSTTDGYLFGDDEASCPTSPIDTHRLRAQLTKLRASLSLETQQRETLEMIINNMEEDRRQRPNGVGGRMPSPAKSSLRQSGQDSDLRQLCDQYKAALEKAKSQLESDRLRADEKITRYVSNHDLLKTKYNQLSEERNSLEKKVASLESRLRGNPPSMSGSARERLASAERRAMESERWLREAQEDRDAAEARYLSLLQSTQDGGDTSALVGQLKAELRSKEDELDALRRELGAFRDDFAALRSQTTRQSDHLRQLEQNLAEARKNQGQSSSNAENENLLKELGEALSEKDRLSHLLQQYIGEVKTYQALLSEKEEERDRLLSRLENGNAAADLVRSPPYPSASSPPLAPDSGPLQAENRRLRSERAALEEQLGRVRASLEAEGRNLADVRKERESLHRDLRTVREMLLGLEGERAQLRSELGAASTRLASLESSVARAEGEAAVTAARLEAQVAHGGELEASLGAAREQQVASAVENRRMETELRLLRSRLDEAKTKLELQGKELERKRAAEVASRSRLESAKNSHTETHSSS